MGQTASKSRRGSEEENDLAGLERGGWISDHNMDVYYEYLTNEILTESQHWKNKILLISPTLAFLIRHATALQDITTALPNNLGEVGYVFFPINDNDDVTEGHGGSHWSLLVVNRHIRLGLHYDSLSQRNYEVAKKTLDKISHLMNEELRFVPQPSPQQANQSDCGVHVLYNTRVLVQRLMHPMYRPEMPWDLSDVVPDTDQNRTALRNLFQERLLARQLSTSSSEAS